jgi:CheY-like chemotaxis protein
MVVVLVADDNVAVRTLLRLTLGPSHVVIEACDGAEALELLHQRHPDIAILDVVMPTFDGLEVCRRLRQNPALRDTPVIILSANATDDEAQRAGANAFIAKPFLPSAVLAGVDALVRQRLVR